MDIKRGAFQPLPQVTYSRPRYHLCTNLTLSALLASYISPTTHDSSYIGTIHQPNLVPRGRDPYAQRRGSLVTEALGTRLQWNQSQDCFSTHVNINYHFFFRAWQEGTNYIFSHFWYHSVCFPALMTIYRRRFPSLSTAWPVDWLHVFPRFLLLLDWLGRHYILPTKTTSIERDWDWILNNLKVVTEESRKMYGSGMICTNNRTSEH